MKGSELIELTCPKCKIRIPVIRQDYDPPAAMEVRILCPECWEGDFDLTEYFDQDGNYVSGDLSEKT